MDNLFVFILVFKYFKVPQENQVQLIAYVIVKSPNILCDSCSLFSVTLEIKNRVLSYGIAGAVIFRAVLIILGVATIQVSCSPMVPLFCFLFYPTVIIPINSSCSVEF